MALLRAIAQTLNPMTAFIPRTGIASQIGSSINAVTGNRFAPAVNTLLGTYSPPAARAYEGPSSTNPVVTPNQYSNPVGPQPGQVLGTNTGSSAGSSYVASQQQGAQQVGTNPSMPDLGIFDQLVGPAMEALNAGVPAAESAYNAAVANTEAQVGKQVGKANENTAATQSQLNQRQTGAEQTTANAVNEARRGFSEMSQGLQSRYGGSTGTGAFAESILGAQTQKNIAGFRNQLMQSLQQIEDTRTQVKMVGDQMLQDLESQRSSQIARHKADLDSAIAQIRARQGELQSRKAELVANAINQYQSAVYQANNLANQFAQRLAEQQADADLRLRNAQATQQDRVQKLQLVTDRLQGEPIGVFNPTTGAYSPYSGQQTQTPGGYMMPGVNRENPALQGTDSQIDELARKYAAG